MIRKSNYDFVFDYEKHQVPISDLEIVNNQNMLKKIGIYGAYVLINIIVVAGVNIGFIIIIFSSSTQVVTISQILLSFFKYINSSTSHK